MNKRYPPVDTIKAARAKDKRRKRVKPQPDWNYTSQPGKLGGPTSKD